MMIAALAVMLATPTDGELRFELRDPDSGEVLETLDLCSEASLSAQAMADWKTDEPFVHLSLDERGKEWLARITTEYVGYRMAIIIEGDSLVEPLIHEPITGGEVRVSGDFTFEQANETAIHLSLSCEPETTE